MTKQIISAFLSLLFLTATAFAQFDFGRNEPDGSRYIGGPRLGESKTQIWQAGIIIPPGTAIDSMQFGVPVPLNWYEQRLISVNESRMPANLASRIQKITHDAGAMEMRLQLARVSPAQPMEIVVEFELQNYALLPPDNPSQYSIPRPGQVPPAVRQYLLATPSIESTHPIFRTMYQEITRDRNTDWDKVEALYSFVQNNVQYNDVAWKNDVQGALALVRQPKGEWTADCKDMTCLFVALCRAGGIPARVVRVPGHCYAEFYLEMRQSPQLGNRPPGNLPRGAFPPGFWFPCQVAGDYAFGGIPEQRVILQKGDSFPDFEADNPRARTIWLREYFIVTPVPGMPPPRVRWVREVVEK